MSGHALGSPGLWVNEEWLYLKYITVHLEGHLIWAITWVCHRRYSNEIWKFKIISISLIMKPTIMAKVIVLLNDYIYKQKWILMHEWAINKHLRYEYILPSPYPEASPSHLFNSPRLLPKLQKALKSLEWIEQNILKASLFLFLHQTIKINIQIRCFDQIIQI